VLRIRLCTAGWHIRSKATAVWTIHKSLGSATAGYLPSPTTTLLYTLRNRSFYFRSYAPGVVGGSSRTKLTPTDLDRNNIAAVRLAGLQAELDLSSVQYQVSAGSLQLGAKLTSADYRVNPVRRIHLGENAVYDVIDTS
jgi:hypothetical protein